MKNALLFLFFCFLSVTNPLSAQEICDNGIDDDNDGLVDLQDTTDCNCPLISVVESLFPNPSFDEFNNDFDCASNQTNGAPDGPGQADCIAGWQQASSSTTDAWHLLTYNGNPPFWPMSIPQPIPSGLAVAGIFTGVSGFDDYREYLGSCLPGGPLEAGTTYRLNFQLGFAEPTEDTDQNFLVESPPTEEFAIYGILDCANIPFEGNFCPETSGAIGWELITTFTASGTAPGWFEIEADFTPDQPYAALAFGGTCAPDNFPPQYDLYRKYYFVDDLILNTVEAFESTITVGGISIFGDDICADDATMIVQDFPGATYQWYRNGVAIPGETGVNYYPPLDDDFPGLYSCRITLPDGCGIAGPVELIRPVVTNAFQDSVFFCPNGGPTIIQPTNAGTSVQSYLWDDGSTDPERVVFSAGTYSVTITSFCEQTVEMIEVTDAVEPTVDFVIEPAFYCPGDTVRAYLSTDWQVDAFVIGEPFFPFILVGDTVTFVVSTSANLFFSVNGNGCFPSFQEDILISFDDLAYSVDVDELSCEVSSVVARVEDLPEPPANFTFTWRDAAGNIIGAFPTIDLTQAGNYSVEVTPLGADCSFTQNFTVSFNDQDILVTGAEVPELSCIVSSANLTVTLTDPDNTGLRWRFEGQDLATSLATITVTEAGQYQLFAFVLDGMGDTLCLQEYSYQVTFNSEAVDISVAIQTLDPCEGTAAAILARPAGFTDWQVSWNEENDPTPIATGLDSIGGLAPGNYILTFTNPQGSCEESRNFTVNAPDEIVLAGEVARADCPTPANPTVLSTIMASAENGTPPYDFQLAGAANETNQTGIFGDLSDGQYLLSVTDANGCTINDPITLTVANPGVLTAEVGEDRQVRLGEGVRLNLQTTGAAVDSILWSPTDGLSCFDCPSPQAAPVTNTRYTVTVISVDGCVVTDELNVLVDETGKVYVPNAFSPNLDGVNDLFTFFPDQSFEELLDFRVYDRWGGEVYVADNSITNAPIGWDGNAADGRPYDTGVYAYFINVRLLNGREKQFTGTVTLLR